MKRALLVAALVGALASPALAHRGHAGLTVVEIDPASGAVSVVHRFSAHDVEPALVSIAPEAQPSLDDPRAVADLETHLRQRFRLDIDGAAIPVTHAATDLAGDNVRVAFTGETSDRSIAAVTIDLDFFPGVHDDQEQQVNVRINGVTRTVVFRPGSAAQTVEFAAAGS
ncbi:MAG: hypothetical protein KKE42_00975 [Alphaproteobacteria bacterium]|uniref:DUF6702 family protein n=1 Tax=Brevundimonas sp. TaxID=1871086 RepID=UPI00180CA606|nr:DUF6702 family protein [Brevundimonas sp.]MBA3047983.1 hypothetical protein [Brevundimonas sp.]MBU3970199.1 hypothetical protein [Alphaproteobacteria bacterium]MBU3972350.1 hypothetical protein [Alphaproteobacteria bacterium]